MTHEEARCLYNALDTPYNEAAFDNDRESDIRQIAEAVNAAVATERQDEREACAKIADEAEKAYDAALTAMAFAEESWNHALNEMSDEVSEQWRTAVENFRNVHAAIRARGLAQPPADAATEPEIVVPYCAEHFAPKPCWKCARAAKSDKPTTLAEAIEKGRKDWERATEK